MSRFDGRVALGTGDSSETRAAVAARVLAEGARVASLDGAETAGEGVLAPAMIETPLLAQMSEEHVHDMIGATCRSSGGGAVF